MSHLVFTSMSDVVRFYCQMKLSANCLFNKISLMRITHYFSCSCLQGKIHVIKLSGCKWVSKCRIDIRCDVSVLLCHASRSVTAGRLADE